MLDQGWKKKHQTRTVMMGNDPSTNPGGSSALTAPCQQWEKVPPFFNHSELAYVNGLTMLAGVRQIPFPNAETLQRDNGERFFSHYMTIIKPTSLPYSVTDMCICLVCKPRIAKAGFVVAIRLAATTQIENQEAVVIYNRQQQPRPAWQQNNKALTLGHGTDYRATVNIRIGAPTTKILPVQMPVQMTQFQPNMQFGSFYYPQVPAYCYPPPALPFSCCFKHSVWLTKRKGRPPHNVHCVQRAKLTIV